MVDVMIASPARVNTAAAMSSPATAAEAFPSFGWLSPRISFSVDDAPAGKQRPSPENPDPEFLDFEFRLGEVPVAMLPADELFSDGKLVPLHLATPRPLQAVAAAADVRSPEAMRSRRRIEFSGSELYAESPRAPRCASRWRELLGLRRQQTTTRPEVQIKASAAVAGKSLTPKSLKQFLHRNPRSDASQSLPLLRDADSEPASISRRSLSSSSSSSGPDHDDLPRLSLDSEKPANRNPPRVRVSRARRPPPEADSPRMNASGRVVFQGLERSSSSPGSFNGGPRQRPRGMERSYSANVRVTPVLNVPVCSLRGSVFGFGQLFSSPSQKRDGAGGGAAARSHSVAGNGSGNGNVKVINERAPPKIQ